jgi:hypothetical protein
MGDGVERDAGGCRLAAADEIQPCPRNVFQRKRAYA